MYVSMLLYERQQTPYKAQLVTDSGCVHVCLYMCVYITLVYLSILGKTVNRIW